MILDKGIAKVFHKINTAQPGGKPSYMLVPFFQSFYGELDFSTDRAFPSERREEVHTDARIRILQNRAVNNLDKVELTPVNGAPEKYRVIRAWHGRDEDSGELITDLNLEVYAP